MPSQKAIEKPRPRGRPPKTKAEQERVLQGLLDATRRVYARSGYHALSVELVLEESGLSRPTFYKHFRSMDEAVEAIMRETNQDLMQRLLGALVATEGTLLAKVEAALVAFRDWGAELGDVIGTLYAELHDVRSPASRHRREIMDLLARELEHAAVAAGRPRPSRVVLDTVLQGLEFLGYHYHLHTARDPVAWKTTRDTMLRLAFGLFATPEELMHTRALLEALGVDLSQTNDRADQATKTRQAAR